MTNKETVERNIGLTFDFVNHLIDNPVLAENLPDDFKLEFIEKDFPNIEKKEQSNLDTKVKRKYVRVRNSFEISK
ncbi:MAG: hypothetical protein Q8R96_14265 [Bacteroidota bacterium]|nr:hypothetical protein [Bacteroidota bacterium]